jgi:hypothetical protein
MVIIEKKITPFYFVTSKAQCLGNCLIRPPIKNKAHFILLLFVYIIRYIIYLFIIVVSFFVLKLFELLIIIYVIFQSLH